MSRSARRRRYRRRRSFRRWVAPLWLVALASCGPAHVEQPLPPNTEQVCTRAVECGAVADANWPQCLACIETVADQWNERAAELFPGKSIDDLTCEILVPFADATNLTKCSKEGWFGP